MSVPFPQAGKKGHEKYLAVLILLTALFFLPTILPDRIGWLTTFIPLPIFYYLVVLGRKNGALIIRNAAILSAAGALIAGSLPVLVFSLAMVAPGVAFYQALSNRNGPIKAGFSGFVFLLFAWLIFWFGLFLIHQTNPYTVFLAELDEGLVNGLLLYEESTEVDPQTLQQIKNAVELLRDYIPRVLPAIFISAFLTITWLNLMLGDWLLKKKDKKLTDWPDYREWKLPESLVWLVIIAGLSVFLLPNPLNTAGINLLIICITVYFFQGLAIVASMLNRWSVPMFIRIVIYALIFIQTYGIIILSFLGLVDIWADFRKLNAINDPPATS